MHLAIVCIWHPHELAVTYFMVAKSPTIDTMCVRVCVCVVDVGQILAERKAGWLPATTFLLPRFSLIIKILISSN